MDRPTFAQMVDYIEDTFGYSNDWGGDTETLYSLFRDLDPDGVYEVILARQSGEPDRARWAPKPAELRALALDRIRHRPQTPAIPETTDRYDWATHCERTYGKVIGFAEAVEQRWAELAEMGKAVVPKIRGAAG